MGNDLFFGVILKWQLEGLQFLALLYWLDFQPWRLRLACSLLLITGCSAEGLITLYVLKKLLW